MAGRVAIQPEDMEIRFNIYSLNGLGTLSNRTQASASTSFAVAQHDNNTLTCEVMGPTSPKMRLTLKQENQEARVSREEKVVQVIAPEAGVWQCLLTEGEEVKMDSKTQVLSRGLNQTMFLAVVLGGTFGFLAFIGLFILCCVRCRHQQRQAARMSQIKRLLSEKKTCQCPHRMQKTHNLI